MTLFEAWALSPFASHTLSVCMAVVGFALGFGGQVLDHLEREASQEQQRKQHERVREILDAHGTQLKTSNLELECEVQKRREVERELQEARDAALETARLKTEFLATMSHEIRTPMNGVIGMTELLLDTTLSKEQREFAETVKDCGRALLTIINDVLDFSKVDAQQMRLDEIEFSLVREVEGVLDLFMPTSSLELCCVIDAAVPNHLIGDPGRLRQILMNLVGNAHKFTAQGQVIVRVSTVEQGQEEVLLRFEVVDQGVGIPAESLPTIFDPFTQADGSTTRTRGGTGLGLAICQRLAVLMGGEIGVESELGEGSTFWFTLRLRPSLREETSRWSAPVRGRVLVVDENRARREALRNHVQTFGMVTESVASSARALDLLREQGLDDPYRLVVLDDGLTVGERSQLIEFCETHTETPVLLVLGPAAPLYEHAGVRALRKPIKRDAIRKAIRSLLTSDGPITRRLLKPAPPVPTGKRLLVAEDNKVNQRLITLVLEKLGYSSIELVEDGQQAFDAYREGQYDGVLLDCQMPVMDGYTAAARIRGWEKDEGRERTPIIALTANAMAGARERCLEAGMDDYLPKPLSPPRLKEALERWLIPSESALAS